MVRSLVPIRSMSTPATAAIASASAIACGVLEHHRDQGRGIERRAGLADRRRAEAELRRRARDRAMAGRRVFEVADDLGGFGGAVDMRHHDAERAAVEHARGQPIMLVGDADQRRDAGTERRPPRSGRRCRDPWRCARDRGTASRSRRSAAPGDVDRARHPDAHAERQFALGEPHPRRIDHTWIIAFSQNRGPPRPSQPIRSLEAGQFMRPGGAGGRTPSARRPVTARRPAIPAGPPARSSPKIKHKDSRRNRGLTDRRQPIPRWSIASPPCLRQDKRMLRAKADLISRSVPSRGRHG